MNNIQKSIGLAAAKIAEDIDADCIVSVERVISEKYNIDDPEIEVKVSFFRKFKKAVFRKTEYTKKLRDLDQETVALLKEFLMEGVNKDYIKKGDRVVCVLDEAIGSILNGLLIIDVDKLFFDMSTHKITQNVTPGVIESVLSISKELCQEGREGKKIGTTFIIGRRDDVVKHTRQLIINPFTGYADDERSIMDPGLRETIKEFSQLDGAFVIDNDGTIITAGAYITANTDNIEIPNGFGTRHRSAAAITKETDAIAVVISESNSIRVLKDGKIIMRI
ncbi:diadenylate cyclase [Candidatus Woesearchaeota archaeon]|nr:diadenylate cyclase [Candidatus Woesearchaeota archaeon]